MIRFFSLLITIFLFGCGPKVKNYTIDPATMEYVNRWESIYGVTVDVNVQFGDLENNIVGECGPKGVTLDTAYWNTGSDLFHEQVIFHEFGHCLLGLGHDSTLIPYGSISIPRSIMYPYVFANMSYYFDNLEYYRAELKTSKASERDTLACRMEAL